MFINNFNSVIDAIGTTQPIINNFIETGYLQAHEYDDR
jgi:hypothetical protein